MVSTATLALAALVALALGIYLGIIFFSPKPTKTSVFVDCGSSKTITPKGKRISTMLVKVVSHCSSGAAMISTRKRIRGGFGPWEYLEEWNPSADPPANEKLKTIEGYYYVVTVPKNGQIRLECQGSGGQCEFEIIDATIHPGTSYTLVSTTKVGCRAWTDTKLVSFGTLSNVKVTFSSVCFNGRHAVKPSIRTVPKTGPRRDPAVVDPNAITLTGGTATWKGGFQGGTLEVKCDGATGECKYKVQWVK